MKGIYEGNMREKAITRTSIIGIISNVKLDFASIATRYEEYIAKYESIIPFIEEWHKESFEIIMTIVSERLEFFRKLQITPNC